MELGKTETFCIFNHNDGCIWHIDTDFYNGCGYKNLDLIPSKSSHDLIFFFFFHFSMQIAVPVSASAPKAIHRQSKKRSKKCFRTESLRQSF